MKQEVNVGAAPGLCRPPDLLPSCYIHAHILGSPPRGVAPPPSRLLILSQLLNLLIFCPFLLSPSRVNVSVDLQ